jgi:intracellular sulfur oxidation DsrE/DsrF family protein
MDRHKNLAGLCAATSLFISILIPGAVTYAQTAPKLHIDVPVTLQHGNVVIDVGHTVFGGDNPFLVGDINVLVQDYADWKTDGRIVLIFHGDAAYIVLNDATYNEVRHVKTGNPYAKALAAWMQRGVQVELCGATAAANRWTNDSLAEGIKVNTDAMSRVTQLEQQGYTLIYE